MKKYRFLKGIALILVVVMLFSCLPLTAIAGTINNSTETETEQGQSQNSYNDMIEVPLEESTEDIYILAEDTSKRGEFEKHFYCSDGTFMAVTYPEAVHYLDDNNQWAEVDNSLLFNSNKGAYEAENGNFNVAFYDGQRMDAGDMLATTDVTLSNQSNEELVSLKNGDSSLAWTLIASKELNNNVISSNKISSLNPTIDDQANILTVSSSASANVLGSTSKKTGNTSFEKINIRDEAAFNVTAMSNQVEYDSLFGENEGITVRYTIYHNRIEEDIFIEKKTDIKSFSMSVECEGLTPMLRNDNSVDFLDINGEMVYHVSSPYTIDAAYSVSNDVDVALSVTNGKCIITYTPDDEWMNSSDRVYPIMLDPSVTTNGYTANIKDTYVVENSTTNHSSEQFLYIDNYGTDKRVSIVSIENMPDIDYNFPILYASLNFNLTFNASEQVAVYMDIFEDEYSIDNATYANYVTSSRINAGYGFAFQNALTFEIPLTTYMQKLSTGELSSVFAIYLDDTNDKYFRSIYSSEAPNSQGPYLLVNYGYQLPQGLEDGDTISLMNNVNSGYLFLSGSSTANGTNVITQQTDNLTDYHKFIVTKDTETGGFVLKTAISESWGVLTVTDTGNVELNDDYIPETQEWLIVPVDTYLFKIVLRSDMSKILSMDIDDDEDYYEGDNVVVREAFPDDDWYARVNYQLWLLTVNGNEFDTPYSNSDYETGVYYINNVGNSGFLTRGTGISVITNTAPVGNLGDTIKWIVTNVAGDQYTIQLYSDPSMYLKCNESGNLWLAYTNSTSQLSDEMIWELDWTLGEIWYSLKNKGTGHYLYTNGTDIGTSTTVSTNLNYRWRFCQVDEYIEATTGNVVFNDLEIRVGSTKKISLNADTFADFADYYDFDYEINEFEENTLQFNSSTYQITGISSGMAIITATHKITGCQYSFVCTIYVDTDVKSARMTRDVTDTYTLCVVTLYNNDKYWYQIDDDGETSDVLLLSDENKQYLQTNYNKFVANGGNYMSAEAFIYKAKISLDNAIAEGSLYSVSQGSDEYWGLWLWFSLAEEAYANAALLFVEGINTITSFINVYHQAVILANNLQLLAGSVATLNSMQYNSALAITNSYASITATEAIDLGITDVSIYTGARPTWRQSEIYVFQNILTPNKGYLFNKSFKSDISTGNLVPAHHGENGSHRPDFYSPSANHCVDVKNYTITDSVNRNNLVNNIVKQYNKRVAVFPSETRYDVIIDVRGQAWTDAILDEIAEKILQKTNNKMGVIFIK